MTEAEILQALHRIAGPQSMAAGLAVAIETAPADRKPSLLEAAERFIVSYRTTQVGPTEFKSSYAIPPELQRD